MVSVVPVREPASGRAVFVEGSPVVSCCLEVHMAKNNEGTNDHDVSSSCKYD